MEHYFNGNLSDIVMPLDVDRFEELLTASEYDTDESNFLLDGFRNGFDIGYEGPTVRQSESKNIPFSPDVGNKFELWSKIMKEVKVGHYAGPFDRIPYDNYIQSPIGLIPKSRGKTRLIFHLSYDFSSDDQGRSLNGCTTKEKCLVKYNDLDTAVKNCILMSEHAEIVKGPNGSKVVFLGKTDLSNTFRILLLKVKCFCWMILKAEDPRDGQIKFFY